MAKHNPDIIENLIKTLKLLPGIVFFKDSNYVYQGGSENLAKLLKFNNTSELTGITDFDIPGDHQENASIYQTQDQLVLEGKEIKQVYVESYPSDNSRQIRFNTKKPFYYDNKIGW